MTKQHALPAQTACEEASQPNYEAFCTDPRFKSPLLCLEPSHCFADDGTAVDATEGECAVFGACCVAGSCAYKVSAADCLAGVWEHTSLVWHPFSTILAEAQIGWTEQTGAVENYPYDLIFDVGDWLTLWDPANPPLGTDTLDLPGTIDENGRVPNQPGYIYTAHPAGWDM